MQTNTHVGQRQKITLFIMTSLPISFFYDIISYKEELVGK